MTKDETEQARLKAIGQRVLTKRKEKGWTQSELADRAGLKAQTVSNVERGVQAPKNSLLGLAKALGESTDYILEGQEHERAKAFGNSLRLAREAAKQTPQRVASALGGEW